ncbi:MAG: cytochrome c3 family protein [Candidatus Omnitrophota bacterium]
MKRYIVVVGLVIAICLCSWFLITSFIRAQEDTITLDCSFGKITFSHKKHTETISCKECHHTGIDNPKCRSCHTKEADINPQKAFHENCIECHKEKAAGPTGCVDCHKK